VLDVGGVARGGKKVTATFYYIHEVGETPTSDGVLFAAGSRGELYRSDNGGDDWTPVVTATTQRVQRMAADGQTVVAVTYVERNYGNLLLKSDDGGRHFYILREVTDQGNVAKLSLIGGVLRYDDRLSSDFGASWSREEGYWADAVDAHDAGLGIVNRTSRYFRDITRLVAPTKGDWVFLDAMRTKQAWFRCAEGSGCWMVHAKQVYRPL